MSEEQDKFDGDGEESDSKRRTFVSKGRPRPAIDLKFDYKDPDMLRQFLTLGGRIVPARVTRLNPFQQHSLTAAVKRARQLALLPNSDRHTG